MIRLYSISLGCPKNRVDTERALGPLQHYASLVPVDAPEEADLVFINTCGFIAPAVEESVSAVVDAIDRIADMPAASRPVLVMAGCLVGRYSAQTLAPDLPEVDLFLDTKPREHSDHANDQQHTDGAEKTDTDTACENALPHACDGWADQLAQLLQKRGLLRLDEAEEQKNRAEQKDTAKQNGISKQREAVEQSDIPKQKAAARQNDISEQIESSEQNDILRQNGSRTSAMLLLADKHAGTRLLSTGPSYAWLKISDGCRHACSFCTIPSIRGPLRSTPREALVREASLLLEQGVKELIVIAQDSTAWGRDFAEKKDLRYLLEGLLPLGGLERLRLMYLYPAGLTTELLRFLQEAGAPFVPYFDVPLQHASQNVLSRMGRPFAGRPHEAVERIRKVFPDAALRTSLIVGFPGETTEDFDELVRFVQETRFHHVGVFSYQEEDGTPAAAMPDQIPDEEKERRRALLMSLQAEISEEILEQSLGGKEKILVDSAHPEWPGLHVGRTWFQAPESDGITFVSGAGVVPGALVEADIVETKEYDLVALGSVSQ